MTIQPYQFMKLRQLMMQQVNVYQSVNDQQTVATTQAKTAEALKELLPESLIEEVLSVALSKETNRAKVDNFLTTFKSQVIPFKEPSTKQIEKTFRKVKKLHLPDFSQLDLRDNTFLGWNDPGTQRKYLLYYDTEGRLQGLYGSLATGAIKNICAICHKESNVAMFLATTKTGGDGTYTKKGNYICTDSTNCNHQLDSRDDFDNFIHQLSAH